METDLNVEVGRIRKAVEWMSINLRTYGDSTIYSQIREILNPPSPNDFLECDTCRAKAGSPTLCKGCLHNRDLVERLTKRISAAGE